MLQIPMCLHIIIHFEENNYAISLTFGTYLKIFFRSPITQRGKNWLQWCCKVARNLITDITDRYFEYCYIYLILLEVNILHWKYLCQRFLYLCIIVHTNVLMVNSIHSVPNILFYVVYIFHNHVNSTTDMIFLLESCLTQRIFYVSILCNKKIYSLYCNKKNMIFLVHVIKIQSDIFVQNLFTHWYKTRKNDFTVLAMLKFQLSWCPYFFRYGRSTRYLSAQVMQNRECPRLVSRNAWVHMELEKS